MSSRSLDARNDSKVIPIGGSRRPEPAVSDDAGVEVTPTRDAALAYHEHRAVERRREARALDRVLKRRRLADELRFTLHSQSLANFPADWQVKSVAVQNYTRIFRLSCRFL